MRCVEFAVSFSDWHSYELRLGVGGYYAWLNSISLFALIQTSWNPSSNHANVRSKYLPSYNQVIRAETMYARYIISANLLLKPLCHERIAQWGRAIWARCWLGHSACNTSIALWGELVSWATLPVFTPDLWVRPLCIFALQMNPMIGHDHTQQQRMPIARYPVWYRTHWKKKWSHCDLKCWVSSGAMIRPGIPSNWRIIESNWLDIERTLNICKNHQEYFQCRVNLTQIFYNCSE